MTIRKSFADIVKLLEENKMKTVSSIMPQILSMCESKKQSSNSLWDDKGKLIAVFCYYHKQWELVKDVSYGSKKSSITLLNSMCKIGTSMWTKKQAEAKKAQSNLLKGVSNGDIKPSDILKLSDDIETTRLLMDSANMPKGFASIDEVIKHTKLKLTDEVPKK